MAAPSTPTPLRPMTDLVRLVVFDLGGTTIHDSADVASQFRTVLEQHGLHVSDGELAAWRGASKRHVIATLVESHARGDLDPARVYGDFQRALQGAFELHGVTPIAGIEDALRELREGGIRAALTTGFDAPLTAWLLGTLGWEARFDAVVTADDVAHGRPAPDMILRAMDIAEIRRAASVVVVGDTANDIEAARRAKVRASVAVLTGAHDKERLTRAQPSAILDSAAEIPTWLRETPTRA
jgi:phosphonatase-like hydrolase